MTMTHRRPAASFVAETEAKISELLASMPAAEREPRLVVGSPGSGTTPVIRTLLTEAAHRGLPLVGPTGSD